jgi:hypothetical protein
VKTGAKTTPNYCFPNKGTINLSINIQKKRKKEGNFHIDAIFKIKLFVFPQINGIFFVYDVTQYSIAVNKG